MTEKGSSRVLPVPPTSDGDRARGVESGYGGEIHQDEIEPHERDALVKSIHTLTAESKGQAAAHAMADHIRTGDMTESEMKSKLYDQLKDDSEAYDHAKTELNDLVTTAHKDRVNEAAESGGKIEAAIDAAHEKGEIISIQQFHSMPEYQKLLKTNTPESQAEFSKINAYRNQYVAERKTEMGEVRFARALEKVGQSDRNKSAREDRDNFMLDISDPEKLREGRPNDQTLQRQHLPAARWCCRIYVLHLRERWVEGAVLIWVMGGGFWLDADMVPGLLKL